MRPSILVTFVSILAACAHSQVVVAQETYVPWRQQHRDEPPWVSPSESAKFREISPSTEIPKYSLSWKGLDPAFADRVERAFNTAKAAGLQPSFVSGFRPGSYQKQMAERYSAGNTSGIQYQPAHRSYHQMGYAVDLHIGKPEQMQKFVKILHDEGLAFTVDGDPNHIEIVTPSQLQPYNDKQLPETYREYLNSLIPDVLEWCPDCVPRVFNFRPDTFVANQREREYRVRTEVRDYLEQSRQEVKQMDRFEKPDPFSDHRREYQSPFGNKYEFDDPFGQSDEGTHSGSGYFGDWTFDDVDFNEPPDE